MTSAQIKSKIKDDFIKGIDSIRYFYEDQQNASDFQTTPVMIDGLWIKVRVTRENIEDNGRMLIAPKLLKRLRINLSVNGRGEHKVEIVQRDKNNFDSNRAFIEMNNPMKLLIKVVESLLAETLEREVIINSGVLSEQ